MKKKLLVLAMCLISTVSANAATWVELDSGNNNIQTFIDKDSIKCVEKNVCTYSVLYKKGKDDPKIVYLKSDYKTDKTGVIRAEYYNEDKYNPAYYSKHTSAYMKSVVDNAIFASAHAYALQTQYNIAARTQQKYVYKQHKQQVHDVATQMAITPRADLITQPTLELVYVPVQQPAPQAQEVAQAPQVEQPAQQVQEVAQQATPAPQVEQPAQQSQQVAQVPQVEQPVQQIQETAQQAARRLEKQEAGIREAVQQVAKQPDPTKTQEKQVAEKKEKATKAKENVENTKPANYVKQDTTKELAIKMFESYVEQVKADIYKNWKTSKETVNQTVEMVISINADGSYNGYKIFDKTSSEQARRSAVAAVNLTAPFAQFPKNEKFIYRTVNIPLVFEQKRFKKRIK